MATTRIKGSDIDALAARSDRITLVDFTATWCGPCRMIHPVLESLSARLKGRVDFYEVDVDQSPKEANQLGIRGVPTLILYHGGREIDRVVGFRDAGSLEAHLTGLADTHLTG
ncbi:thioredoxin family protein [Candidatus Fermentibacterales bacterium]|nr:thioredoxin family protein [Candidatus Fermentibacterales bacterium]